MTTVGKADNGKIYKYPETKVSGKQQIQPLVKATCPLLII